MGPVSISRRMWGSESETTTPMDRPWFQGLTIQTLSSPPAARRRYSRMKSCREHSRLYESGRWPRAEPSPP